MASSEFASFCDHDHFLILSMAALNNGKRGHVLMVANYAPDVGFAWWLMEKFWIRYAELASAQGLPATVAFPVEGTVPAELRNADIGLVTMRVPVAVNEFEGTLRVLTFIRQHQVRVLYLTDRPFSSLSYLLYRIAGVRWILNHDHTPGDRPPAQGLKSVLKWVWRRLPFASADYQLCVSPFIAKRAELNALIPRDRIAVVQNGIDELAGESDPTYASKQFGLPESAIICVTVARATSYKGIEFVIEVASRCTGAQLSAVYFVHCGDGPELNRFRQMAETAGVADRVIFAGRRTDVANILASADLALHPSLGEAFSLSILEYMRAGLVLFVPDIPSVSQAVTDGQTGVVYPAGNVDEILVRLTAIIDDDEKRGRIGKAAKRSVAEKFSTAAMMKQFDAAVQVTLVD